MRKFKPKKCARCGEMFIPVGSNQKFCKPCAEPAYREYDIARGKDRNRKPWGDYHQKGKLNNNWKGGTGVYKALLEKCACEICGSTENLLIHHKDHNRRNNAVSNLMVMCKKCHQNHHTRRDSETGRYIPLPPELKSKY